MIWRADSTWDRACCLARFPSRLRRILASEGRLDFTLLCPLSLLLTDDESLSDWTPTEYNTKTMRRTVIDGRQRKIAPGLLPGLCFLPPAAKKSNCCWSLMQMLIWSCLGPAHNEGDNIDSVKDGCWELPDWKAKAVQKRNILLIYCCDDPYCPDVLKVVLVLSLLCRYLSCSSWSDGN